MWQENMPKFGYQDILAQNVLHMIMMVFFVGPEFQFLLQGCLIKDALTSSKNPQANAICEQMHQTVGDVLCTLLHGEPPQEVTRAK